MANDVLVLSPLAVQLLSVSGALLILAAYVLSQVAILGPNDIMYQFANFIGAALLALVAVMERQFGFIILEGTWALISIVALLRVGTATRTAPLDVHKALSILVHSTEQSI